MEDLDSRNLLLFFVLAFAITWAFAIPKGLLTPAGAEPVLFEIAQLGALGPAIAAVVMVYRERGKAGLRQFLSLTTKWRIGLVWYLVILLVPLVWQGILPSVGAYAFVKGYVPALVAPSHGAPPWKGAWWFLFYILFIGGGQEELGWRGYALPRLQKKHSAVVSSLILGVLWSTWHLPMMLIPGSSLRGVPFPAYLILLTALSFVYTWLYNNTESIFACVLYHTWSNFVAVYLMVDIADPMFGLLTLAVQLGVVILLIGLFGAKRLSRKGRPGDNGLAV